MFNFSNKDSTAKPKKWHWYFLATIILLSLIIKGYTYYWPKTTLVIAGRQIKVLVANTDKHRLQGWGGKEDMGRYQGMLFIYQQKAQHTMVMRDMNFPLDIIWLDGSSIVDMAPNLTPEPDRTEEQLTPYFARLPSTSVLEVSAGFIAENKLKIGDNVEILK